jgi:hypothetical protein
LWRQEPQSFKTDTAAFDKRWDNVADPVVTEPSNARIIEAVEIEPMLPSHRVRLIGQKQM